MTSNMISTLFLALIKAYQMFVSPVLPARCRYYPTCSQYGTTAIKWHGARRGGVLTLKRIGRCHPLGGHGIDFVPLPLYKECFTPVLVGSSAMVSKILANVSRETILIERGIYRDSSSYAARLNSKLNLS